MDIPLHHSKLEGQRLAVRTGGLFSEAELVADGVPLTPIESDGGFVVSTGSGESVLIVLSPTWIDPIPSVQIEKETIELARPLSWFEYLWMCLPLALVLSGGALGVLLGLAAIYGSARIFRSGLSTIGKYALSALVSGTGLFLFLVLSGLADLLLRSSASY